MPQNGIKKNRELNEIVPSDLEEVARFISRMSRCDTLLASAVARLSWILLENPARVQGDPVGWLLRSSSGEVVGCMCCAPQKFCFGQQTFTLMMANSFYVDSHYKGSGTSIFLKYLQLGRRYPLFVSSANANVARMWQKLGAYSLGNADHETLGIVRWPPVLAEAVYRKMENDQLARFTAAVASPFFRGPRHSHIKNVEGELSPLKTAEEAASICAEHRSKKITNCRDAQFLQWRYFPSITSTTRLFAFRPRAGEQQFMIAVNLQNRGYKQQIRTLQVLDIWGEADPQALLAIASCLWREFDQQIDMLVFRCLNPLQRQALMSTGFKVRSFAAPIAWCIDKFELLPAKTWYFVPADGDMFL